MTTRALASPTGNGVLPPRPAPGSGNEFAPAAWFAVFSELVVDGRTADLRAKLERVTAKWQELEASSDPGISARARQAAGDVDPRATAALVLIHALGCEPGVVGRALQLTPRRLEETLAIAGSAYGDIAGRLVRPHGCPDVRPLVLGLVSRSEARDTTRHARDCAACRRRGEALLAVAPLLSLRELPWAVADTTASAMLRRARAHAPASVPVRRFARPAQGPEPTRPRLGVAHPTPRSARTASILRFRDGTRGTALRRTGVALLGVAALITLVVIVGQSPGPATSSTVAGVATTDPAVAAAAARRTEAAQRAERAEAALRDQAKEVARQRTVARARRRATLRRAAARRRESARRLAAARAAAATPPPSAAQATPAPTVAPTPAPIVTAAPTAVPVSPAPTPAPVNDNAGLEFRP